MPTTIVTRKGQITIPVEMRRALDLQEGEMVSVELQGDKLLLRRAVSVVDQTFGSLGRYMKRPSLTAEEEREAFEAGVAAEVAEEEAQRR